jgi:hypothetical protein
VKKQRRICAPTSLSRRRFLRGALAGGVAINLGLPLLESMVDGNATALAQGGDIPKRFGTFYWGGGVLHSAWVPSGTGAGFTLPSALRPFQDIDPALRNYVTLLTGFNHRNSSPGHIPARGISLSASHHTTWDDSVPAGPGYRGQSMPEPSVDVLVREAWGGLAPRDSVHVALCAPDLYLGKCSWNRGGSSYNAPETRPSQLFSLLFSGGAAPEPPPTNGRAAALARLRASLDRSALDAVLEDANSLAGRLGRADRARLDDHLTGLRELELRIADYERGLTGAGGTPAPVCDTPMTPSDPGTLRDKGRLMSELLAFALACDLTRVFSYEWSANQSGWVYSELGISGTHHDDITHSSARNPDLERILTLIMTGFAELANALRQKPELDGNVLDNTLVFGTSEHASAGAHDYTDHPLIYVGGAGGGIRRGIHFRHPSPGSNNDAPNALLTAVRAVGVPLDALGMGEATDSRGTGLASRRTSTDVSEILA